MNLSKEIKKIALDLGFDQVGIAQLQSLEEGERAIAQWVRLGRHGGMKYLEDFQARRERFFREFPDAKSVIVLGVNYYSEDPEGKSSSPHGFRRACLPDRQGSDSRLTPCGNDERFFGRVARYAWGKDYHQVIGEKHKQLISELQKSQWGQTPVSFDRGLTPIGFKSCVDIQPIPERYAARAAGLGFIGKNTMLLSKKFGPWLFLSEIVTNMELEEDRPTAGDCGTCNHCQTACPTGALDLDYNINARKCIAYLTIEHKGEIPEELRPKIKDWIFGCDECLTSCPFTSKSKETTWKEFRAEEGAGPAINIEELFEIKSNAEYERKFRGTALLRASRKQMLRNACLVIANSGDPAAIPLLEKALRDPSPLVRTHAAWGLEKLKGCGPLI